MMLFTNENESEEYYTNNEGYKIRVLKREGHKAFIEFQDEHKFQKWVRFADLKEGSIKNPYHKSICGLAYFGNIEKGSYTKKEKQKFINIINNVKRRHEKMKKDFYCFASFLQVIRKLPKYQNWHEDNQNEYCLTTCKNEEEIIDNFEVQNISREEATKGKRNKVIVVKNMFDGSIEVFNSLTECAEEFSITPTTVSNYAKKNKELDGCIFYFFNEYNK
jgi:hypothetical protein